MKKTFKLTHPKIKYERLIEGVKSDIRKYLKRERKKKLPEGVDFWDFDCKFGSTPEDSKTIHVADFGKSIDKAQLEKMESFYVEILAKQGHRTKKIKEETDSDKSEDANTES